MTCRILIGDDHEHARQAMRMILENDPGFEIVAEAANGREVILLSEEKMPDMILMDINMPMLNGLKATRIIKERFPEIKIVIVTVSDDVSDLFEAIKKGAQGYLLKNLNPSIWLEYLRSVAADEAPMPREIARRILREFSQPPRPAPESGLTVREREVLSCVARGLSNKEIACQLSISEYTVKNHLKNIMQKLHMNNRVQLTRYAFEHGWVDADS
ncbi:DNA-binding response regulator, NarL/FixJ family, contains REC and HTH domains [Lihuaxuella thermophila]|uniref:DNA-binding response regulator, NarL/FixJ family, contains REC and HTH domains n=2 Tax=Lihuaxuella thermophila TaxID=1173111 RepID=A0A1H8HTB2_9BACL|nr:DNA-binding response regulator, NarL/FixJ family, contains REC and HTH domains [Lihuaxuella thermophila]